jgi:L-alanine-DL-glutamate epimerase-like enolase superfamily enzyme
VSARVAVDRFEGEVAVLDVAGTLVNVPVALLPAGAREGSVLAFVLDAAATEAALAEAQSRLDRLKAATPQGPGSFDL